MITPPSLNKGDYIGLVSPSSHVEPAIVNSAVALVKRMGFRIKTGKHLLDRYFNFAGNDPVRLADFQEMLDDPEVKLILCTRGGYGSVRILDYLNFDSFVENPKWIIGYSDITAIQCHVWSVYGIESIHGIMPYNFPECGQVCSAIDRLFQVAGGANPKYQIPAHPLNRTGKAYGKLVGGNLSILVSLLGSISDIDTDGCVLFLEEVGEALYRFDRMMLTLKRSGKLSNLAGLIVGGLTEMADNKSDFGKSAEEIVADIVSAFDYPVCFDFPAGHIKNNYPLIIGREVLLDAGEQSVKLDFK
ncbi:MAG TPA: LD-carboxypeptidase [Bacteroidales bacterium]|nr:LD-carboxypeptidase [Bacteroidales bacterium]HPR56958.1 LD-carboxypeptidase [Bacteroidales bacterium]HRW96272.1 LD-carboxypeptidase [Bacteroidales bacterium]